LHELDKIYLTADAVQSVKLVVKTTHHHGRNSDRSWP